MIKIHRGKVIEKISGYKIIDCKICGFFHIFPFPEKKVISEFYRNKFYQEAKPKYIKKVKKEIDYWNNTYQDKMEEFERYIKKRKKRILDIGCNGGFFLKFFKARGYDVLGIEPSDEASRYARKFDIEIINKNFEQIPLNELGRFDIVHLSFVLEHLRNPQGTLIKIYKILNKNGIVCIESPSEFNPLQKIIKEKLNKPPWWIVLPDHINYFTPESLRKLVEHCGFKVLEMTGTFPMEFFVLMGDDYIGDDKIGRRCHQKRMNLEMLFYKNKLNNFKKELYQFMIDRNIGREIIIYGRK